MTSLTADSGRSRRWREALPSPIALGLVAAVACSLSWVQWWRPVIEHDDWRQILSSSWFPASMHTAQLAADGRWLNYWTWLAGEPVLSVRAVVLLFAAGWLLFTAVFVRTVTTGWWAVPLAIAVYTAPMIADVAYWPATLFPAMTSLAVGASLLWLTRGRFGWHLLVLAVAVGVTVLGYPPFALILLMLLVAMHHREAWGRLLAVAGTFTVSYLATVVLSFALNDLRFGEFGLRIALWRHPSPLNGFGSLVHHLRVGAYDWRLVVEATLIPLTIGLIALAAATLDRHLRRSLVVLVLAFGICLALDLAPTILHGVSNPFRSMGWAWLALLLVIGWIIGSARPAVRVLGRVALVVIAAWGALYGANGVIGHQRFQNAIGRVEREAVAMALRTGGEIILAPRSPRWTVVEGDTAEQFRGAIAKGDPAMSSRLCVKRCTHSLPRYFERHRLTQDVVYLHGLVVVRLPLGLYTTALDVLPKPGWLQPVPWPRGVRQ